jgi:hypothetical protein
MPSRLVNSLPVLLCIAALLFLLSGHVRPIEPAPNLVSPLVPETTSPFLVVKDGFAENAVYPTTAPSRIGPNLKRFGSWLGSDAVVGNAQSAWFHWVPELNLQVAGYPGGHGCELYIELQTASGVIKRIPVIGDDPGDSWQIRTISLPGGVSRFRLMAADTSTGSGGWVGFSQPFQLKQNMAELLRELALVALTASAALVALLFPGLWLRRLCCKPGRSPLAFLWISVPGFLALAILGLLCWLGPPALGVRRLAQLALTPLFAYALYHSLRFPIAAYTTQIERRILLVILLLTSLCISKAIYSQGPAGELYAGKISRTNEVGGRADSRIAYHVLQLVASRSSSHGHLASDLFGGWGFSSRPPLVALAAVPLVFVIPAQVPQVMPDQAWTVFDPQGFSAYRIVMIVIACCSLTAAFGVALIFLDEPWAFLAYLVTVTSPFVIHEIYFTWPKLEAASFLLLAAYLILRRRFLIAGLLWGIGYLCHPLVLFSAPALLAIAVLPESKLAPSGSSIFGKIYAWGWRAAALLPGLGLAIAIWFFANPAFNQTTFLSYFRQADGADPTVAHWLLSRWNSLANTLLPLNLFLLHSDHRSLNSVSGPSPAIVHFYFQYWNTLPFGVGITYFCFLLRTVYAGFFRARAWLLFVFVIPFAFFWVYWGFTSTGLLPEGLHPWVLGLLIFSVVIWRKIAPSELAFSVACSIAILLRGIETLLMLLLPAIWSTRKLVATPFLLSDSIALFSMVASAGWLYTLTFRQAASLWQSASTADSPLPPSLQSYGSLASFKASLGLTSL